MKANNTRISAPGRAEFLAILLIDIYLAPTHCQAQTGAIKYLFN